MIEWQMINVPWRKQTPHWAVQWDSEDPRHRSRTDPRPPGTAPGPPNQRTLSGSEMEGRSPHVTLWWFKNLKRPVIWVISKEDMCQKLLGKGGNHWVLLGFLSCHVFNWVLSTKWRYGDKGSRRFPTGWILELSQYWRQNLYFKTSILPPKRI